MARGNSSNRAPLRARSGRARRSPLAVLLAAAVLLSISTAAVSGAAADRSGAFIGYIEETSGRCANKLETCDSEASANKCLTDPYRMRSLCPVSCLVQPCVAGGSVLDTYRFKGAASDAGTSMYARNLASTAATNHFNSVTWGAKANGDPNVLRLSSLGLGTYLGAADAATDEAVMRAVLYGACRGWNVIDTAANYRGGRAEAVIGRALSVLLMGERGDAFPEGRLEVARDALFISSKAGYLTPELKRHVLSRGLAAEADLVGGNHCIKPACLRASLEASLASLRLETLDLLYLHNPAEVQLPALGRNGFRAALREAFKELEALRKEGKLSGYGVASWDAFRSPPDSPVHLDLEELVILAREVGGPSHGFLAIQAPINLKMDEAFTKPWQQFFNKTATDAAAAAARVAAEAAAKAAAAQVTADGGDAAAAAAAVAALPSPQPAQPVYDAATLTDAVERLSVQLFASAPLLEAQLVGGLVGRLDDILALQDARSTAGKLIQYARSMPGVTAALVGHKAQEHVLSNVALAAAPQLPPDLWRVVAQQAGAVLTAQQGAATLEVV